MYDNSLTQLHAIGFVHKELKLKILEVESKTRQVVSPRRTGKKSCDLRGSDSTQEYFFEVKDASSETMSQYPFRSVKMYTPMSEEEIRNWIIEQCREADKKGADYLICRVPVWVSDWEEAEQEFCDGWIREVFEVKTQLEKREIVIEKPGGLSEPFKGIYIIKAFGHLRLSF